MPSFPTRSEVWLKLNGPLDALRPRPFSWDLNRERRRPPPLTAPRAGLASCRPALRRGQAQPRALGVRRGMNGSKIRCMSIPLECRRRRRGRPAGRGRSSTLRVTTIWVPSRRVGECVVDQDPHDLAPRTGSHWAFDRRRKPHLRRLSCWARVARTRRDRARELADIDLPPRGLSSRDPDSAATGRAVD